METSYEFKKWQLGIGIYLGLIGYSIRPERKIEQDFSFKVAPGLYVHIADLEMAKGKLLSLATPFIMAGLGSVESFISRSSEEYTYIVFKEVIIANADFQLESFYYAVVEWAAKHFGFEIPQYQCYYDRELKKFIFPDMILEENK